MKSRQRREAYFFLNESNLAPRERKEAGTMPPTARGTASSWFTGWAKKPADGEVSLTSR